MKQKFVGKSIMSFLVTLNIVHFPFFFYDNKNHIGVSIENLS